MTHELGIYASGDRVREGGHDQRRCWIVGAWCLKASHLIVIDQCSITILPRMKSNVEITTWNGEVLATSGTCAREDAWLNGSV